MYMLDEETAFQYKMFRTHIKVIAIGHIEFGSCVFLKTAAFQINAHKPVSTKQT